MQTKLGLKLSQGKGKSIENFPRERENLSRISLAPFSGKKSIAIENFRREGKPIIINNRVSVSLFDGQWVKKCGGHKFPHTTSSPFIDKAKLKKVKRESKKMGDG